MIDVLLVTSSTWPDGEPGLYLDVLAANAEPFADLVVARLG